MQREHSQRSILPTERIQTEIHLAYRTHSNRDPSRLQNTFQSCFEKMFTSQRELLKHTHTGICLPLKIIHTEIWLPMEHIHTDIHLPLKHTCTGIYLPLKHTHRGILKLKDFNFNKDLQSYLCLSRSHAALTTIILVVCCAILQFYWQA